jgi:hypothetical protein
MATIKTSKRKTGISEIRLSLSSDMPFDKIVATLKQTLTLPELPGFRGCRPCLSGLDRFLIEDPAVRGMR